MKTFISLLKGIFSLMPFSSKYFNSKSGKTVEVQYYIQVFLSHQKFFKIFIKQIDSFLEIGPGEVPGLAMIAYAMGVKRVFSIDRCRFALDNETRKIASKMCQFFSENEEFEEKFISNNVQPKIQNKLLKENYKKLREIIIIKKLKEIANSKEPLKLLNYSYDGLKTNIKFDLIISQACLEHVDDVFQLVKFMRNKLYKTGIMSHSIDLSSHNILDGIDQHFHVNNFLWRLIRGKRKYFINRLNFKDYRVIFNRLNLKVKYQIANKKILNYFVILSK